MVEPRDLPTDPAFARQVEHVEAAAWMSVDTSLQGSRQVEVRSIGGASVLIDPSPNQSRSRIFNLGVERPATPEAIQAILKEASEAGVETMRAVISPIARPGTLARLLAQEGFQQVNRSLLLARYTGNMPEPDSYFRIRRAERADAGEVTGLLDQVLPGVLDWCTLLAGQIGTPNWGHYVAIENDAVVGMATIYRSGEMAWLSQVWVLPQFRNHGTQEALIAHAVREAAAAGAEWITSTDPATVPERTRDYDRLGFSMVYQRTEFRWDASSA